MPNRILRDGILTSEKINALSPESEVFYRRLMSVVDDFGRIDAHPQILLAWCYPFQLDRISVQDVSRMLAECARVNGGVSAESTPLISVYTVNGKPYLQINNFGQRERTSKFPAPSDADILSAECPQDASELSAECPPLAARASRGHVQAAVHGQPCASNSNSYSTTHSSFSEVLNTETGTIAISENFHMEKFEEIAGMFLALGKGISITDRMKLENLWVNLSLEEKLSAHAYAAEMFAVWQSRPTDKIPESWNFFGEKHWERKIKRVAAQTREPTKREKGLAEAVQMLKEEDFR